MISRAGENKKRDKVFEIEIVGLSHEGRGIGKINGKTVFVDGALPDETVNAKLIRKRSKFDLAQLKDILVSSQKRVIPECKHFGVCGGCSLQHMSEKYQLDYKEKVLVELLGHHSNLVPESIFEPISADQWGYRQKARLGVKCVTGKGGVVIGFREKFKGYITDSEECKVLDPRVGEKIILLRMLLQSLSVSDHVPQLEVATTKDSVAIVIRHLSPLSPSDYSILRTFGRKHNINFYLQSGGLDSIFALDEGFDNLYYELGDIRIGFSPTDFTQINSSVNKLMVAKVMSLLEVSEKDFILDLFCGIGNFSLPVAALGAKVKGVELDEAMVVRAKENARLNRIKNCSFESLNLQRAPDIKSLDISRVNKILLDPPRSGCNEVLSEMNLKSVKKVVYVSCNPLTFARDAAVLNRLHHFELKEVGVLNMFPHTSHFECVGSFER